MEELARAVEAGRRAMDAQIGHRVVGLEACPSTQQEARRLAEAGAAHGTVVWAREQTEGRGRGGRSWLSPPTGLWCSVVVRPGLPLRHAPRLTGLTCVGLCDGLRGLGLRPFVKWPNDLMFPAKTAGPLGPWRKVAGILVELAQASEAVEAAVVGFGVNLEAPPGGWPPDLADRATDLKSEGFPGVPALALETLLEGLEGWLNGPWTDEVWRFALDRLREASATVGSRVRVPEEDLEGEAVGLDEDGALLVQPAAGEVRRVVAADVWPAGKSE